MTKFCNRLYTERFFQLRLSEENDRLLDEFEHGVILQAAIPPEIVDELVQTVLVIEVQPGALLETQEMILKGLNHLDGPSTTTQKDGSCESSFLR